MIFIDFLMGNLQVDGIPTWIKGDVSPNTDANRLLRSVEDCLVIRVVWDGKKQQVIHVEVRFVEVIL
jgi:hypothetical protein